MRIVRTFLAFPALALCSTFTGTVVDLSGTPIVGAVVKTSVDSATTAGNGAWVLARTSSVAARMWKPISVASHLVVENGRPRLVFGGVDASGHRSASMQAAPSGLAAGRSAAAVGTDTLKLFWNGKRLVVLPIASADSTEIVLHVDTAWSDDAGIPWNPAIGYGSVLDARDGKTYRTVGIGSQRWMAENLNHATDSSWWYYGQDYSLPGSPHPLYNDSLVQGAKYGRLYKWASAMELPDSCNYGWCLTPDTCRGVFVCDAKTLPQYRGVCPAQWHLPNDTDWSILRSTVQADPRVGDLKAGRALKPRTGWDGETVPNEDLFGFRALGASYRMSSGEDGHAGTRACFRSSREGLGLFDWQVLLYNGAGVMGLSQETKLDAISVRCLKDTP